MEEGTSERSRSALDGTMEGAGGDGMPGNLTMLAVGEVVKSLSADLKAATK